MNTHVKNKWWHRLAVVVFWITGIVILIIASAISWEENHPYSYKHIDNEKSYITCEKDNSSGLVYFFNKNGIYTEGLAHTLSSYSKDRAKQICSELSEDQQLLYSKKETALIEGGMWNYSERDVLLQKYKNSLIGTSDYTVYIEDATESYGSWNATVIYQLIILFAVLVLMYLISSIYNYIIFGEKFKSPLRLFHK